VNGYAKVSATRIWQRKKWIDPRMTPMNPESGKKAQIHRKNRASQLWKSGGKSLE
jgi:hypothetical protein